MTSAPAPPVHVVARRHAVSFASLPEFTNSTVSSPDPAGIVATSRSASSTGASVRYRMFVFSIRDCRAIASATRGCACPTTGTLL